ncbi:MAG: hypothetical protein GY918_07490, partial [Gammaproteobacteria bacterium]|nr:hypothetical protein [Gammaproteobacteria bacterium]
STDHLGIAYITSDYNTGWMNGDIKLAALSDTDDTDVTGSELVTNGTFDSDTSGWYSWNAGRGTISWDAGTLKADNTTGSGDMYAAHTFSNAPVAGKLVEITAQFTNTTDIAKFYFLNGSGGTIGSTATATLYSGVATWRLTVPNGAVGLMIGNADTTSAWNIDNISCKRMEPDRSVNGNGLA